MTVPDNINIITENSIKECWISLCSVLVTHDCKSKNGDLCDIPFVYDGKCYDSCINVDNGGVPWCYTDATNKQWQTCSKSSCPNLQGLFIFVLFNFTEVLFII